MSEHLGHVGIEIKPTKACAHLLRCLADYCDAVRNGAKSEPASPEREAIKKEVATKATKPEPKPEPAGEIEVPDGLTPTNLATKIIRPMKEHLSNAAWTEYSAQVRKHIKESFGVDSLANLPPEQAAAAYVSIAEFNETFKSSEEF